MPLFGACVRLQWICHLLHAVLRARSYCDEQLDAKLHDLADHTCIGHHHRDTKQAFKVAVDIESDARRRFAEVQSQVTEVRHGAAHFPTLSLLPCAAQAVSATLRPASCLVFLADLLCASLQLTTLQNAQHRARAAKGDRVAAFGQPAAQLHGLIQQNANRFHRTPIGPVGSVLALKEARCVALPHVIPLTWCALMLQRLHYSSSHAMPFLRALEQHDCARVEHHSSCNLHHIRR